MISTVCDRFWTPRTRHTRHMTAMSIRMAWPRPTEEQHLELVAVISKTRRQDEVQAEGLSEAKGEHESTHECKTQSQQISPAAGGYPRAGFTPEGGPVHCVGGRVAPARPFPKTCCRLGSNTPLGKGWCAYSGAQPAGAKARWLSDSSLRSHLTKVLAATGVGGS